MDKTIKQFTICSIFGVLIMIIALFSMVLDFRCKYDNACNYEKINAVVVKKGIYEECDDYCRMMIYIMFDMPNGSTCNHTCSYCDKLYNDYIINNKYDIYTYNNECHVNKPFDTIRFFGIIIILGCISFMLIIWFSYDLTKCKKVNNHEQIYLQPTKQKYYSIQN